MKKNAGDEEIKRELSDSALLAEDEKKKAKKEFREEKLKIRKIKEEITMGKSKALKLNMETAALKSTISALKSQEQRDGDNKEHPRKDVESYSSVQKRFNVLLSKEISYLK